MLTGVNSGSGLRNSIDLGDGQREEAVIFSAAGRVVKTTNAFIRSTQEGLTGKPEARTVVCEILKQILSPKSQVPFPTVGGGNELPA